MAVTINGTNGVTTPEVVLDNSAADGAQVVLKSSGYSDWNLDNYSGRLRAYYGATEYLTVNTSGNLGIGTSSPTAKLQVKGSGEELRIETTGAVASGGAAYQTWYDSTGSRQAYIGFGGANNTFQINLDANGPLTFSTAAAERARIDSSGNLLVGKTSASDSTLGAEMQASGAIVSTRSGSTSAQSSYILYSTGASAYRFYVGLGGTINATSTTITGISDQRLKENIRDLDDGLDKVMALQPRKFDWKDGKGAGIKDARGFIAQEFETVFPDMIEEWLDPAPEGEEPYKAVNANLIPTLVKAIQEQQAIITALTARVTALEGA